MKFLILLFTLSTVLAEFPAGSWYSAYRDGGSGWQVSQGRDGAASAKLTLGMKESGWDVLNLVGSPSASDDDMAYGAGFVEGAITTNGIWDAFRNFVNGTRSGMSSKIHDFILTNDGWVRGMAGNWSSQKDSEYWRQVDLVMRQFQGLYDGYDRFRKEDEYISYADFLYYQLQFDLGDIQTAVGETNTHPMALHCSVLIKPTVDGVFQSHDTWSGFSSMLRIYKHYDLPYESAGAVVTGVSFSSFPAILPSGDDFYVLSNNLVVMETTNEVFNTTLFEATTTTTVMYWIRLLVANRMGSSGAKWTETFAKYNSGTYNNQWMVIDNSLIEQGKPGSYPANTLWVLEQIPGMIERDDQTKVLNAQGYWPSYNIPFYKKIWAVSGYAECVKTNPSMCSYTQAARAQIFKRDQHTVKDLRSMRHLMRYNQYQIDPLSLEDACRGISARCDLNVPWVKNSLNGWAAFGGIDNKITSSKWTRQRKATVVAGPTWDDQPPFAWTDEWKYVPHYGMPKVYAFDYIDVAPEQ